MHNALMWYIEAKYVAGKVKPLEKIGLSLPH